MRTWRRTRNEIPQLVDAFFINDPYYPRPNPADPLYHEFSNGYFSAVPKEFKDAKEVGEAFLRAIEKEQATRTCSSASISN
jgi:hypothetical protein